MSQIGTVVSSNATASNTITPYNTANWFLAGLADWGPVASPVTIQSLAGTTSTIGPRSGTNQTAYDALDVYFREATPEATALFSRVAGPGASAASLTLADAGGSASILVNAIYVGNYGNSLRVSAANAGGTFTLTLSDTTGNTLAVSPAFSTRAAAQTWAVGTVPIFVTLTPYANAAGLPTTVVNAALTGGTDDRAHVTIAHWTTALNAFPATLGPGQLSAPGVTNSTVNGIWSAIASAVSTTNRVGICDMDDGSFATVATAAIAGTFNSTSVGPVGFWTGNLTAPGVASGTTRSIPPSPAVAALCGRVDASGNPNLAAAGQQFPLQFCTGSATLVSGVTETYSPSDVSTLNSAGINTFATRFGTFENFGFVSSVLPTTDPIYWQFNHQRLRMALLAQAQIVAEPFLFSQLDGQGADVGNFTAALDNMLRGFWNVGALYGATPQDAYSINTGPSVNTNATMQAGQLNAILSTRMSPFAQLVSIVFNSVPITSSVPPASTSAATVNSSGFETGPNQ